MAVHKKFPALGRGLDALISTEEVHTSGSSSINEVPIGSIQANPNQPRREFDPAALEELAESIRQIGIIQPITLRKMDDGFYQIIAGERRWRASQLAGLDTIPAYIRTADDENMMQMALAGFAPNVLDERTVQYQCDCSAERTKEMLLSLGRAELERMRDEDPNCEVVCHFCHSKYQYDLNALLAEYDAQAAQAAEAEHTVQ